MGKRLLSRWFFYGYVGGHVRHVYGPRVVVRSQTDCIVLSVIKDCEEYITTFIDYYLAQGFAHIVLMDNGSTDRTLELASQYGQDGKVTILQCLLPFGQYKRHMCNYMAHRFSTHRWCLLADCDEFFDYPGSECLTLSQLIQYLNRQNTTAVLVQMLDMYPQTAIGPQQASRNFRAAHRWFEVNTLEPRIIPTGLQNQLSSEDLHLNYGGVRQRIFEASPLLSKFSLIKPDRYLHLVGLHLVSWAKVADISCVVYHYKFLAGFSQRVTQAIRQGQYYQGSAEYKQYQAKLSDEAGITLWTHESIALAGPQQLIDLDLLTVSERYRHYCAEAASASSSATSLTKAP
ncbi:MAG: glycosyltransferase family 2 protein [Cyanobacteria bacterium J06627_3]